MKNNKEKNNLLQKNVPDKIKYIRQKILLDRLMSGEDIDEATEELMKSMSDLEIYGIIREENAEIIISSYAPFITNFNNFMKLLDNSPEYISKYVTLLDPYKIQKYYGRKSNKEKIQGKNGYIRRYLLGKNAKKVYNLIVNYLKLNKNVPLPIIVSYVNCSIHGRWFFSRYSHIAKILNELMVSISENENMDIYNDTWKLNILPTIFEFIPYQYANYGMINYKTYYDMGGKFIDNSGKDTNVILFLESYVNNPNRTDELPDSICNVMYFSSPDDETRDRYRQLVISSISHNGNNVKLVNWGSELSLGEIKEITNLILNSTSPLTNFDYYHYYYTTTKLAGQNAVYNIDFIKDLLKRGLDYSTLQSWINCLYFIEDAMISTDTVNLEIYMSKIFPSPLIQSDKEQSLRIRNMNDYIIQELSSKMSTNWISSVLYPVIFTNKDIFESLSPASIQYITRNIDFDEVIKIYPQIVGFPSIYKTLQFSDVEHMANINYEILKYVPFHFIPASVLSKFVINMKKYIPLNYINNLFKIPATLIVELMSYNCGYGYILDLPTTHQINAILEYCSED